MPDALFTGAADVIAASWLVPLLVVLGVAVLGRAVGRVRPEVDAQRRFSAAQRRVILSRAGSRCEHCSWLDGRCQTTESSQADHVHPHSRGGATAVENGQALCRRHNKQKATRVPSTRELERLARRRQAYFPAGTDPVVVRRSRPSSADRL